VAEQPQRALKGTAEPLRTAVVTGTPVRGAGAVPFIGRVEELAALHAMVSVARDARSPCVAVVSGEPGMGKSRLVSRFAEQSAADRVAVRRCLCRPPGEQSDADLLRELIEP